MPHGPNREEHSNSPNGEEAEQAFQLPKDFQVPITIQLPETMKQHAIIEKTARFIASQGIQMEILLKAKQSNNRQFEFLAIDGALNPYYKFILNAIKNGTYPTETDMSSSSPIPSTQIEQDAAASMPVKPIITVPTIKYKPSANCAYTQLISKIKGVPLPAVIEGELANMPTSNSPTPQTTNTTNSNFTPVLLQYNGNTYVSADAEEATNSNSANSQSSGNVRTEVEVLNKSSALSLAQDYASETESEAEEEAATSIKTPPPPKIEPVLNFPVPTETLKNIIDKTAMYVIKNGRQFEETLRAKSVDRFTFLLYDNEHYPYYLYKVTGDPDAASKEQKQRKAAAVAAALMSKKNLLVSAEKSISPVCFSIKSKEDSVATMLQPALPCEPSDDDEESNATLANSTQTTRTVPEHVQKAIQLVESQLMARNAQLAAAAAAATGNRNVTNAMLAGAPLHAIRVPPNQSTGNRFDIDYTGSAVSSSTKGQLKVSKAEMARNALFEQQQQNRQKELKKAEEKVKDKLAKIAREKLGCPISKEKQLQLERKRKAMAFLTQIKDSPSNTQSENKSNKNGSDSEESVHSIPITSYGPEDDGKSDEEEKQRLIEIPTTHIAGETSTVSAATPATNDEQPKTPKPPMISTTATVTVSDDDDVQLVSEIKAPPPPAISRQRTERKRQLRSRTRDSSEDATASTKPSRKHAKKRKQQRHRSRRSSSESSEDGSSSSSESTSSSSSATSSYSSSSSATTATTSTSTSSDNSTDNDDVVERSRSRSRRHHTNRKRKSRTKSVNKSKKRKLSKSRKSSSRSGGGHKKKSKKAVLEEEYKAHKERERKAKRTRKHKRSKREEDEEEQQKQLYEHESERRQRERRKKDSRKHRSSSAYADEEYRQQRAEEKAAIEASRKEHHHHHQREHERERYREREEYERRSRRDDNSKHNDRELERERERKEKKKKRER